MVKKNKLSYKNFNVCQLIDKKKMKLQYPENYDESKKEYHKTNDLNCKTKKGTIRNINKRIIAGALTLALVATLSGCTKDFHYSREIKDGKYVVAVTGSIDSKTAGELKILELKVLDENMLFLARVYDKKVREEGKKQIVYEYYDVFKDFHIITLSEGKVVPLQNIDSDKYDIEFIKEQSLEDYLPFYGNGKKEYTVEELKEVFEKIEEDYKFQNNKKLIKGK